MNEARLVRRRAPSTPRSGGRTPLGTPSALPDDILEEAARRLGRVALALLMTGLLFVWAFHALEAQDPTGADFTALDLAGISLVTVASLAMYAMSRSRRFHPALVLNLGLVYQVVFALAAAFMTYQVPLPDVPAPASFTPTAILILVFPLVLPLGTGKTLLASLMTAGTDPLALLVLTATGMPAPDSVAAAVRVVSNVVAVALALMVARVVHNLGRRVSQARELGSYRLVRRLGEGGMGEVWEAEHRLLARPAAIKLIRSDTFGAGDNARQSQTRRRFEREARATALLHSPHTVNLYDFGVSDDGDFFTVMELLEGVDLERLVARWGPVSPARAVYFLHQACESLAEAHGRGLVHRDIKPANLFACRLGLRVDHVKLLDFGLVRPPVDTGTTTGLTQQGAAVGTPAYIAPEAAQGSDTLDGRADLYALGCVAFWLLTARTVFDRRGALDMVLAHVHDLPEAPSRHTELTVPPELDALVLRCLAKRPEDRFASALALQEALLTIPLAEPWTQEQAQRWWNTHLPATTPARE